MIRTHSCASSAPTSWKALNPGIIESTRSNCACTSAIRGSVVYVASSGGGQGLSTSQLRGTRKPGSWASRSNKIVVPVRGWPTTTSGRAIGWSISG